MLDLAWGRVGRPGTCYRSGAQQIFNKHLSLLGLWDYKIIFGEQDSTSVETDVNQIIRGTNKLIQSILITRRLFVNSPTHKNLFVTSKSIVVALSWSFVVMRRAPKNLSH